MTFPIAHGPCARLAALLHLAALSGFVAGPTTAFGADPGEAVAAAPPASSASAGERRTPPVEARRWSDYALPALEIVGFDFLLNRFEHSFGSDRHDYAVDLSTIRRNLRSGWGTD